MLFFFVFLLFLIHWLNLLLQTCVFVCESVFLSGGYKDSNTMFFFHYYFKPQNGNSADAERCFAVWHKQTKPNWTKLKTGKLDWLLWPLTWAWLQTCKHWVPVASGCVIYLYIYYIHTFALWHRKSISFVLRYGRTQRLHEPHAAAAAAARPFSGSKSVKSISKVNNSWRAWDSKPGLPARSGGAGVCYLQVETLRKPDGSKGLWEWPFFFLLHPYAAVEH